MTFLAIGTVDRWGRRVLMLGGAAGLSVIYLATGWAYHNHVTGIIPVILVVAAIACYCCTLAPVVWVILSEIFPNRIRGAAMSISVVALWMGNFLSLKHSPSCMNGWDWRGASGSTQQSASPAFYSSTSNSLRQRAKHWNSWNANSRIEYGSSEEI